MTKTCTTSLELLEGRRKDFGVPCGAFGIRIISYWFSCFSNDFQLNVASALVELVFWAEDRKLMERVYGSGVVGIMNYNSCLLPWLCIDKNISCLKIGRWPLLFQEWFVLIYHFMHVMGYQLF